MNSRNPYARFYGPNGWLPNDRWELRLCAVVEQTPTAARNYGSKIYFWDAETYETSMVLVFDREGVLWKVIDLLHGWSEDASQPEVDRGKNLPRNIGLALSMSNKNRPPSSQPIRLSIQSSQSMKLRNATTLTS